jgi:hypothetical protein
MIKAEVVLKTGKVIEVALDDERTFTAMSLQSTTLQAFLARDEKSKIFIQGDNILYVETFV